MSFKMSLRNSKIYTFMIASIFGLSSSFGYTADLENGKELYEKTCASCHNKKLTGGAGFNLKDEKWVHGESADDILVNVKKGFAKAGMPPFEHAYSEQQLKDIVAYVLSRKEGLRNLTYKIYHIEEDTKASFANVDKLVVKKSGKLPNNLMDFSLPEVKNYIIEFEGDLFTAKDASFNLFGMTHDEPLEVQIDGKVIKAASRDWMQNVWPLKSGQHKFKFRFSTAETNPDINRNFKLFVSDEKLTEKLFALSTAGKNFLNKATVNIKAENEIKVVRKRTVNLPVRSITVGYPEKINYAFSTSECAVAGLWTGDMINVGPNVEDRGRDGSVILGDWAFHSPENISHVKSTDCRFIKYNRKGNPEFRYQLGEQIFSVKASPQANKQLALSYQLISGKSEMVQFSLPTKHNLSFSSNSGDIKNGQWELAMKPGQKHNLLISVAE